MSSPPFKPKDIWQKLQAGVWDDDPGYRVLRQAFREKPGSARSIAEDLSYGNTHDGPQLRYETPGIAVTALTKLELEWLGVLKYRDTACAKRAIHAFAILKKGPLQPQFTTFKLIGLGIIYLREICGQKPVKIENLHNEVIEWQRENQERRSISTRQWDRDIARPEFRPWLPPIVKSTTSRKAR